MLVYGVVVDPQVDIQLPRYLLVDPFPEGQQCLVPVSLWAWGHHTARGSIQSRAQDRGVDRLVAQGAVDDRGSFRVVMATGPTGAQRVGQALHSVIAQWSTVGGCLPAE